MTEEPPKPASFSSRRRWGIFLSVLVSIAAMIALMVMLNYLGARYYARLSWSAKTNVQLTPQTLGLLKSITNQVKVVVYFDKKDPVYGFITELLDQYRNANPKISVQLVDYERDAAAAAQVKNTYRLGSTEDKNLVIFECNSRFFVIPGKKLGQYELQTVPDEQERKFSEKLKAVDGELWFSSALLNITSPKPMTACFLQDHGEHAADGTKATGYQKFLEILAQNNIRTTIVTNAYGTNLALGDYSLLIIAGPTEIIHREELDKIKQYLAQGGRMFVLFNSATWNINTGLETMLADDWGVQVGHNVVKDPENSTGGESGQDVVVSDFTRSHELVDRLVGGNLQMILPRSIGKLNAGKQSSEAPTVEPVAFTGEHPLIQDALDDTFKPAGRKVPLIAAVEKESVKGVFPERGAARIVVAGDSVFLDNQVIEAAGNRDFARYAVQWLMNQQQLMHGIGPRPVTRFDLMLTEAQMTSLQWIFLAGMPGGILAFGGLVWLRRRH